LSAIPLIVTKTEKAISINCIPKCEVKDVNLQIMLNKTWRALGVELLQEEDSNSLETEKRRWHEYYSKSIVSDSMFKTILFEKNKIIIGFADVIIVDDFWSSGKLAIINKFYIKPHFRSIGYINEAVRLLDSFTKKESCKCIRSIVDIGSEELNYYLFPGYNDEEKS